MVAEQRRSQQPLQEQQNAPESPQTAGGILERGKSQLVDRVHEAAEAVRQTERCMRESRDSTVARLAGKAVSSLEGVERYISEADPRSVMRDINAVARRQPELFLGSAVLAGLLLGRFLRSHPPEGEYTGGEYGDTDEAGVTGYGDARASESGPTGGRFSTRGSDEDGGTATGESIPGGATDTGGGRSW